MEFTIDRSKWRCGGVHNKNSRGKGGTSLLNEEGFMCCLGQTCRQVGIEKEDLLKKNEPRQIDTKLHTKNLGIFVESRGLFSTFMDTELSKSAMIINDTSFLNQKERESKLRELFKRHGHKIKFVGKSVKTK